MNELSRLSQTITAEGKKIGASPVKAVVYFDNGQTLEINLVKTSDHVDTRKSASLPSEYSARTFIICELLLEGERRMDTLENFLNKKRTPALVCKKYMAAVVKSVADTYGITIQNIYSKIKQLSADTESEWAKALNENFNECAMNLLLNPSKYMVNPLFRAMVETIPSSYSETDMALILKVIDTLIKRENPKAGILGLEEAE